MRIVLAMSGGVDSSAAAWLLKQQGHEVIGLFMRSGAVEEQACILPTNPAVGGAAANPLPALPVITPKANKQGCCSAVDAADARRVADVLEIPFHALNFKEAFRRIKDYFADEYLAGRTPNPCVMCNNWLKFGKLWEFAEQLGADAVATGHYARIVRSDAGQPQLCRGLHRDKDQSYVLAGIRRDLLGKILFPVGDRTKVQIRELAAEAGLRVASKPDSQEICFIPDQDYVGFLHRYREVGETAGEFVDPQGVVLGQHAGFEQFTIGQRRGLGITFGEPRFVIRIEPETRRVVLGTKDDLSQQTLIADRVNWLTDPPVGDTFRAQVQIRSQHPAAWATVTRKTLSNQGSESFAEAETGDEIVFGRDAVREVVHVEFDEPQFGVAPGQAAVLYDGERVLAGGWIATGAVQGDRPEPSHERDGRVSRL